MEIDITCPYCGKSMHLNIQPSIHKEVLCELCGSPLKDEVENAIKNFKPPQQSQPINPTPTSSFPTPTGFPTTTSETSFPFASNIPAQHIQQQSKDVPFQFSQPGQEQGVSLVFPQINQTIKIPNTQLVFHFGRNTILPLVSPNQFDIEWLNSISRVVKQNNQIVRQHFIIRKDRVGKYTIQDSQSRWGTWINRQQIKGKGEVPLVNGDKIELMLSKPNVKDVFPFVILFNC